jgi:putative membrane-bound dehydrogenase-like protein
MLRSITLLACLATSVYAAPVSLFDGKSLEQWEGSALWKVVDGEIHGGSLTEHVKHNDFIATKKSFSNFELKLKLRLNGTGFVNSGVQIRSVRVPGSSEMAGYQVDYGPGWYGKIYDESRRNKVIAESKDAKAVDAAIKPGEWNEYVIRAEGARIRSWINGVAALDYIEPDANIAQDGHIGIQVHGGGKALIQVKDITIEELPAAPGAPTWDKLGRPGEKKPKEKPDAGGKTRSEKANAQTGIGAGPKTPAEQLATFTLPEGLEMDLIASEIPEEGVGKFVAVYFDAKGAMWTMTALEYPVDGNENAAAADALYKSRAKDKILVYDRDAKSPTGFVSKPRVFADGLAIPLGILPYKDGCYVQHGPDLVFLRDTDGDGKSDKREVILTGLGVQDSHLFPHQFTRAPGGWIWMAQGLFNNSKPVKPGDAKAVDWKQCSMAKMRMDGSQFEVTSTGPNNIWGLAMTAEGETFIQEANDYGYPVMPFHEYAYYPGGMAAHKKSYQPDFPPQAEFRMGGTGLSGLALTDKDGIFPDGWRDVMLVANPITNRIQTIKMHRDGPRWKLEQRADIVQTTDSWFRPVALTLAPDGCVYVVDWYNKIISHNEVPRNHPDRDKTRGRIWRIKPKAKAPMEVPDFTKLSGDELIAKLGGASTAQHHMAWQAIVDRGMKELAPKLKEVVATGKNDAARIGAMWAAEGLGAASFDWEKVTKDANRNVRREAVRVMGEMYQGGVSYIGIAVVLEMFRGAGIDQDFEVRAQAIRTARTPLHAIPKATDASSFTTSGFGSVSVSGEIEGSIGTLLGFALPSLAGPTAKASHGNKTIKVGEAYEREYERFLVRMFLERHPEAVAKFLETDDAKKLPLEARLLASLALDPKSGAPRVAALLPQLTRPPENEEILRLVQHLDEPGVADAVKATLGNPATAPAVLNALLELRAKLDPARLSPLVADAATKLLASKDAAQIENGVKLVGAFKIASAESSLVGLLRPIGPISPIGPMALRALGELGSTNTTLFADLATTAADPLVRDEALAALAGSKAADAPARVLALYPKLAPAQRRLALDKLTTTKAGASAVVGAVSAGTLPKSDIDAATLDRLLAVLGEKDAELAKLVDSLGSLFRPVLALDGTDNATIETGLTLDGAFTVETWVKLDEGISNADGILGAPGKLDMNFYGGQFRVYVFPPLGDVVIAKTKTVPGMWQHIATTRDAKGNWKIYIDGELSATGTKTSAEKIEKPVIGWTSTAGGFKGQLAEYRIWNHERSAEQIRESFDRSIEGTEGTKGTGASLELSLSSNKSLSSLKLGTGAKVVKTSDLPPVLTADAAAKLDADFTKYRALAGKPGDKERGKAVAAMCQACHLFGNTGGQIGPNLSGVGAMGAEAILRNILTPNAAMESGYRIFRVEQRDGSVLDAFFVSEDKDAVVVRLAGAADQRIAKKNIVKTTFLRRSLMPEGLLAGMNDQQVSDLFAYLLSLK